MRKLIPSMSNMKKMSYTFLEWLLKVWNAADNVRHMNRPMAKAPNTATSAQVAELYLGETRE